MIGKLYVALLFIISGFLIVVLQYGFIFLMIAMLPSFVAHFIDPDPSKHKFQVVFFCNIAAVLPTMAPMFEASFHFQPYNISVLVSNPNIWLFIYGGAAIGWCLIFLCNQLAIYIVGARNDYVIHQIEEQQRRLIEEWGPQVKESPVPIKKYPRI
jgi:hypothetical protein